MLLTNQQCYIWYFYCILHCILIVHPSARQRLFILANFGLCANFLIFWSQLIIDRAQAGVRKRGENASGAHQAAVCLKFLISTFEMSKFVVFILFLLAYWTHLRGKKKNEGGERVLVSARNLRIFGSPHRYRHRQTNSAYITQMATYATALL